jgi:hypothetical protein
MISPMSQVPRSVQDYIPSPHSSNPSPSPHTVLQSRSPSQHPNGPPISPPKTRSASADDSSAALVEDWRAYTAKLRGQSEGERAHMAADRARIEEVMAEERVLWDTERAILKARIAELEAQLEKRGSSNPLPRPISNRPGVGNNAISFTSPGSNAASVTGSVDSSSSRTVPQESGRNADGSPFYAPAPRNPSRTFDSSQTRELRVDSITAPRESAIRVTSKELTSSDFIQSPPSTHDLDAIPEIPTDSIDISHIQPELEGVLIKASAVFPTFAAKILSPYYSPRLSPDTKPPPSDATNRVRSPSKEENQKKTLEVVLYQPENKRLTLHAGHTPNHSISKFPFLGDGSESGNATPTQEQHNQTEHSEGQLHRSSVVKVEESEEEDSYDHGDKELSGTLGLTNESAKDDVFLAQLVEKLEEARKSEGVSPSTESTSSKGSEDRGSNPRDDEDEKDEGPPLKLKPSFNFGRPLGSM